MCMALSSRTPMPAAEGLSSMPSQLRLHHPGDPGRDEVEAFIRGVYAERYGADLRQFAPVLVSLHDEQGLAAAVGYREAVSCLWSYGMEQARRADHALLSAPVRAA